MLNKTNIILGISTLFICLTAPATSVLADRTPERIHIGGLLHLTGEWAPQGQAFYEGLQLAAKEINGQGGVNGQQIELDVEDTRYIPAQTHTASKKLISQKNITAAVATCVSETKVAGPLFQREDIPLITLWDSSPELEAMGQGIFGIGTWVPSAGQAPADFAKKKFGAKTAVVINSTTEWSLSVSEAFIDKFKADGGKVLHVFENAPTETDFRSIIARTKSLKPDILYVPIDGNLLAFFIQLKAAQFNKPVLSSDVIGADLIAQRPDVFEGIYQSQTSDPEGAKAQAMTKIYKKEFNRNPAYPLFTAWGYDAVHLLAKVIEKEGSDPSAIKDALYQVKNFAGVTGELTFNELGSARKNSDIFQITSGKFAKITG